MNLLQTADTVRAAFDDPDNGKKLRLLALIIDGLRFKHGFKYNDVFEFCKANIERDISESEFEEVMYRMDYLGV